MKVVFGCDNCGAVWAKGYIKEGGKFTNHLETVHKDCPECEEAREERLLRPFGRADLDQLAMAIYRCYHAHEEEDADPWTLYAREEDDGVVQDFRCAAEAAMEEIHYAGCS